MHELLLQVMFYIFAGLAVLSALMVISLNNPVHCVLFLVLAFFAGTGLWILASAEFLALILILVYVGAVMTLFLFVVMMLNINLEEMKSKAMRYLPFGLILVALLTGLLMVALPDDVFNAKAQGTTDLATVTADAAQDLSNGSRLVDISDTQALGMVLYTDYVLAFELAAVILLVAIVGAITLAHRKPRTSKTQDIARQLMLRREDRIRLEKNI